MSDDLLILDMDGTPATATDGLIGGNKISPEEFARRLAALVATLRDAFRDELPDDYDATGSRGFGLDAIDEGLAVSAEGILGIVKGSATGSITLHFARPAS